MRISVVPLNKNSCSLCVYFSLRLFVLMAVFKIESAIILAKRKHTHTNNYTRHAAATPATFFLVRINFVCVLSFVRTIKAIQLPIKMAKHCISYCSNIINTHSNTQCAIWYTSCTTKMDRGNKHVFAKI